MSADMQTTGMINEGGVPIAYRKFGVAGATPVLVVHGLSYFSYDWIDIASALAVGREVVAIDMRGFGDSGRAPDRDYSLPANAADFVRVFDHFAWSRAMLLGHSMGARHCLWCAGHYASRVAALVAVDFAPDIGPRGQSRVASSVGTQPDYYSDLDACIEALTGQPAANASAATRARFEQYTHAAEGGVAIKRDLHFRNQFKRILETGQRPVAGFDLWKVLAGVECPSLFVRGRQSDMFASETVAKVMATNARAEIFELDTGHDVGGQDPTGLIGVVEKFIARHEL